MSPPFLFMCDRPRSYIDTEVLLKESESEAMTIEIPHQNESEDKNETRIDAHQCHGNMLISKWILVHKMKARSKNILIHPGSGWRG